MKLQYFLALIPLIWLIFALVALKWKGHWAVLSSLGLAIVMAIPIWGMSLLDALTSSLEGALAALWPIFFIILAAMYVYDLSVKTGAMEKIKQVLASISNDKRVLVLIVVWAFGGFMEGMAGFGTAIAIPAAMLVGLGVNPITAAVVAMINNAFPTAFGAVGIPTTMLSTVTGLDPLKTSAITALQMAPLMIVVPFLMVAIIGGGAKAVKGVIPEILVAIISFVVPEVLVAEFVGPELAVTVASIVSLICIVGVVKLMNKKVPEEYALISGTSGTSETSEEASEAAINSKMTAFKAWLPFILILVLLLATSVLVKPINDFLAQVVTSVKISTSAVAKPYGFKWLNQPGIWIFVSAFIGGLVQGESGKGLFVQLGKTTKRMLLTAVTIMGVVALAKVMQYSGMINDMAQFFVKLTGKFYTFISPIIGALGAFVTGSGTNTQILLGNMQTTVAKAISASPYWLAAANQTGAGLGKVISPQSIAIVVAATGLAGRESEILKKAFKWIVILLVLAMLLVGLGGALFLPILGLK